MWRTRSICFKIKGEGKKMKSEEEVKNKQKIVQKHIDTFGTENEDDIDVDLDGESEEFARGFESALEWWLQ